ncbi:MAG: zf-HC2 domain-containing protein [Armatimonadota bacterium]
MKCERAQELFSDYLEDALEHPMAVAFDQHLESCSVCAREFASFRLTWRMLEALPEVEPPSDFAYAVMTKIRMQRETERCSRPRWQTIWRDVFQSKIPARVFAGAATLFILGQVVLHTPARTTIAAWLVPNPMAARVVNSTPASTPENWKSDSSAEAWLQSGLSFEMEPSGSNIFRLVIKPDSVTSKDLRVYLMPSDCTRFDRESIKNAGLIFTGTIGEKGQVIPFVLGRSSAQEVMTALIEWENHSQKFAEAVFMPVHLNSMENAVTSDVNIKNTELYAALQETSATYGVVILANADLSGAKVTRINETNVTADDVLYKICTGANLRWRPIGSQVYIVERKMQ